MAHHEDCTRNFGGAVSRRTLVAAMATGAGMMALGSRSAAAAEGGPVAPPSTITSPPRDFGPNGAPNVYFTDPDVLTVDPSFDGLRQPNAPIQRLWTGSLWAEGPAWNSQGRYLVWSDIPNNRQLRWLEDDGHVSVFRTPTNNGNGNTFDFQGRQITCEHLTRRVVRYELDGSVTVIADNYNGKHLNSPNDVVPHPDGSIWFTDPPYGSQLFEGAADAPGGPGNPGHINPKLGQPGGFVPVSESCRPTSIGGIQTESSISWSPRSRFRTRTASASRPTTRSSMSSARARGPETPARAAKATYRSLTSAPTTSSRTRSFSPIAS